VTRTRPYRVTVDSGSPDEPRARAFASLRAAWRYADAIGTEWQPFVEVRAQHTMPDGSHYWPLIDREGQPRHRPERET
jgi:hypothetical protein